MEETILDIRLSGIAAKYRPLFLGPDIVQRERLHQLISTALRRGPILMYGGAGHGKTTALSSFVQAQNLPVVWCTLDEWDQDPAQLLSSLFAAVCQVFPEKTSRLGRLVEYAPEVKQSWQRVVGLLLQELEDIGDCLLVLDDLHVLEGDTLSGQILDTLLRYLPAQSNLLLSARRPPKVRWLVRQRAQGGITEIGPQALRFTRAEVKALAKDRFGLDLAEQDVDLLLQHTLGWPIGLGLALLAWQQNQDVVLGSPDSPEKLFDYLSLEVLDVQDPSVRQFLLQTAILPQLTPAGCNHLLGRSDADRTLERLARESLFVTTLGEQRYRYHPQFRAFLQRTLRREYPAETIVELHRRAAHYYTKHESWEEAVVHYVQAEDTAALVPIIQQRAPVMIRTGRQETLARWMALIPQSILQERPALLRYQGELALLDRDIDGAISILGPCRELALAQDDRATAALALALLGRSYERLKEAETANRLLAQAIEEMEAAGVDDLEARLAYALIRVELEPDLERAVREVEALRERARQVGDVYIEARAMATLSSLYFHLGWIERCHKATDRVRQLQQQYALDWMLRLQVDNIEGHAFWAKGQLERALDVLRQAEQFVSKEFYGDFRGWLLVTTANVLRDMEDPAAEEYYRQALALVEQNPTSRAEVFWEMGWLMLRQGKMAQARQMAGQSLPLCPDIWVPYAHTLLGALDREQGYLESAESYFAQALGGPIFLALRYTTLMHRAYNDLLREDETAARRDVELAFQIGEQSGIMGGYFWQPEVAASLCAWALARGIYPGYAQKLAITRLDSRHCGPFLPLLNHQTPEVRRQAVTILGKIGGPEVLVALRVAITDSETGVAQSARKAIARLEEQISLRILCLGEIQLWRAGELVQDWDPKNKVGRRRVQALLAFLLLQGDRGASRDDLECLLWKDDWGTRLGASKVYMAISALRQVLEPDLARPADSKYLRLEKGRYRLRVKEGIWLDLSEFQQFLHMGQRMEAAGHGRQALTAYQQAVVLYRGKYLGDAFAGANDAMFVEDWASATTSLHRRYIEALLRIAQLWQDCDHLEEAISSYQQALQADPLLEQAHAELIRLYNRLGRPEQARRHYLHCCQLFQEELGEGPGEIVQRAYRRE